MNFKLTTTQRNMLFVAAQREDRCIGSSADLRGSAARTFVTKLMDAGFAREIRAKDGMPVWRHNKDTGHNYSLKLTASGIKIVSGEALSIGSSSGVDSKPGSCPPRENSKLSQVMLMLSQECGITIDEISKAMGWLPHTTRATLTGLRKRGVQIIRLTREGERGSSYRIEPSSETELAA